LGFKAGANWRGSFIQYNTKHNLLMTIETYEAGLIEGQLRWTGNNNGSVHYSGYVTPNGEVQLITKRPTTGNALAGFLYIGRLQNNQLTGTGKNTDGNESLTFELSPE
ncbi:MAG: hypothetical protein ACRCZF_01075, partial [Gemmataceae bacterium]